MGTMTTKTKPLYNYEEIRPDVYQQVANHQGEIKVHDHIKMINTGERGGYLQLSNNATIRDKQLHDIALTNSGVWNHNSWLSHDSVLKGDFKLPFDSIIEHSRIAANSNHALLINDSFLNHAKIKILPNTSASIVTSDLKNSKIVASATTQEQVLFVSQSKLDKMDIQAKDSSQMILNSELYNAQFRGNCDIDTTYLAADETAKLSNMSSHTSDIELHKAMLIANDSDIDQQSFRDDTAINNYLVIKNNHIRGEQLTQTGKQQPSHKAHDLDLE